MTRNEVVTKFIHHGLTKGRASSVAVGIYNGRVALFSYDTPIAVWVGDTLVCNRSVYSRTTSSLQNMVRRECPTRLYRSVQEVNMGAAIAVTSDEQGGV